MKKQMIALVAISLAFASCSKPKEQDKDDSNCGCHAKENALDLRGTTETSADALNGPTAKL